MKSTVLGLVVAVSILSNPVFAQTNVYGVGVKSCGAYLTARQVGAGSIQAQVYLTWLTGYLTGVVQQFPEADQKIAPTDTDSWGFWLDNYCHQNPTAPFALASNALIKFLLSK